MQIQTTLSATPKKPIGCIAVPVFSGRKSGSAATRLNKAADGALLSLMRTTGFKATLAQTRILHNVPGTNAAAVLLVGCGRLKSQSASDFLKLARATAQALKSSGLSNALLDFLEVEVKDRDTYWQIRQIVNAVTDTAYRFEQMKGKAHRKSTPRLKQLTIVTGSRSIQDSAKLAIAHGMAIADGVSLAKDLGNLPGNLCTPKYLAERARKLAAQHAALSVSVRGEAELKRLKMGSFLSVSRGSVEPARLICLEYQGGPRGTKPVVLVGKGVTFDSGGISIKPGAAMDEMKFDMCGAASVMGTLQAVAQMNLAVNVVGIVAAAENMPSGSATKPGDIVTSMSGQTIEILNTDAEGRLILCDALSFAARYKPDTVIDIATLTGACVVALGAHASGLFANHEPLARALLNAGEYSGDRAWELPVWDEYVAQLKSNFADMANIGGRDGGASTAAAFLSKFTKDYRWAHLDIAGTAWRSGANKGATGRPVRLLTQYILDKARRRPKKKQ